MPSRVGGEMCAPEGLLGRLWGCWQSPPSPSERNWPKAPLTLLLALLALGGALSDPAPAVAAPPAIFATNLIANGDAEAGVGSSDGSVVPVPGWTVSGNFTAVQYGAPSGFPSLTDPGPSNRGANFFAGGPNNASSSASQLISIASAAPQIDAGAVTFALAGFLGGFQDQGDNAVLSVTFENGDLVLGTAQLGPVTAADRGNATGLLARSTSGAVPVGTRQLLVTLQMTRAPIFFYNDGYADNLSLTLKRGRAG